MSDPERVRLYLSSEHACGYLAGRAARNAYLDPEFALNPQRYGFLLSQGFRRSGVHVYRPHCLGCQQCIAARVPVQEFRASRGQRRCAARNAGLRLSISASSTEEQFALYGRYLAARHPGGGMDGDNREAFHSFLECAWNRTEFWEWREAERLLCVAVVDRVPTALSAVYTFFDPAEHIRSLGTWAILQQIAVARASGLAHLYLGYWVPGSQKMDYKKNFSPMELLTSRGWKSLEAAS